MYVDIHTHLTHGMFDSDRDEVIKKAISDGLGAIVVNGLNPVSNRHILQMADKYTVIKPALGIYPIDAVNSQVNNLPFPVAKFNVMDEVAFIRSMAESKKITAIGECGLDGYWVGEETFPAQEAVFTALIEIALEFDLPLIIHTRKREKRTIEILKYHKIQKVNFHCYGGKTKLALDASHDQGWWFSIPCNSKKNQAFAKLLSELPESRILTETDAPYLPPIKGERNVPSNVIQTVNHLAELKNWEPSHAKALIWQNYQELFKKVDQPG